MDLHSIVYVETTNSNLICCICRTPFVEPVVLESCGHTFCKLCINQSITSTKSICPIDRSPLSDTKNQLKPASKLIVNMVNELLVYCPNRELGCSHVGERQLIHSHIKDDYCHSAFSQSQFSQHIKQCPVKVVSCLHSQFGCKWSDHSTLLSTHELLLSDNDRINNEIQLLNENLIDLEFKQNDALMKETLKIQQEVTSLKSTCNSLKMQINYLLMERRTTGTGVSAGENPSKLSQSIHNANNSSSSVQMSQENGSYIKSNHSNMKQLSRKIGSLYTEFPRHEKL
ncbi:12197_t:CDS:2 [Entrophospora sp. SA101]|nr:12197_t:CDS:2 [Entrophospora sp. SA101]